MTIKQAPAISSHTAGDVSTQTAETRPPTLVVWGKNDPIFLVAGAESYKKDLTTLEFHPLDTGHFALEEDGDMIADLMRHFLRKHIKR